MVISASKAPWRISSDLGVLLLLLLLLLFASVLAVPPGDDRVYVLEARLRPDRWNVSAASPAFWRGGQGGGGDKFPIGPLTPIPGRVFFPVPGPQGFRQRRVVLHSLADAEPPPRFSTHSFTRIGFDATLARLASSAHAAIQRLPTDHFYHHVRDNRFGGDSRDDVLDVCGHDSVFGRTVREANASEAVLRARATLKSLVNRATALTGEQYRRYLLEHSRSGSSRTAVTRDQQLSVRLECEEVFASHTAVDTIVGHLDTDNMGPEMTIAIWLPLNPVLSYPLVIGGGARGGGHGWRSLGGGGGHVDEMWSTHGLVEGEALAYLAPAPPSSSAMHGSAALPTDLYPDDINPLVFSPEDGDFVDFHPRRVDPAVARLRHRVIIVARAFVDVN